MKNSLMLKIAGLVTKSNDKRCVIIHIVSAFILPSTLQPRYTDHGLLFDLSDEWISVFFSEMLMHWVDKTDEYSIKMAYCIHNYILSVCGLYIYNLVLINVMLVSLCHDEMCYNRFSIAKIVVNNNWASEFWVKAHCLLLRI